MNDLHEHAELIVSLAKQLGELALNIDPNFDTIYFRFTYEPGVYGSTASYTSGNETNIISALRYDEPFEAMNELSKEIIISSGKDKGLLLFVVDKDFNYTTKFEYDDLTLWQITKLNGENGVPKGI